MTPLLIGNGIALVASILMVITGYMKHKKKILFVQTIQIGLSAISNLVLGGITGAIINVINCIRNIICYKGKLTIPAKVILIALSIGLSVAFNNLGVIGLLPVIGCVAYIMFMDIEDVIKFKFLIIFTMALWLVYDIVVQLYTAACFDALTILTNIIAIVQLKLKDNKKEEKA